MEVDAHGDPGVGSPVACTTWAMKLSFLKGLSTDDRYKKAIGMLKGRMKFEDIDQLPAWASWSSGASYLPASFYSLGGFELAITDICTFTSSAVDMPATLVLAFGLALRGLATGRGYDTTSGRHKRLPEWVDASALSDESESRIFNMISRLV